MININLVLALVLAFVAQILAYFQLQGQFMWPWMKNNIFITSLMGVPISYLLIKYTKYCSDGFGGEVWPGRIIAFAIGAIVFALMSHFIMKEAFTLKTIVSLCLASMILLIQIFWK